MTARPVDPEPDESGASRKGKPSADRIDAVARVLRPSTFEAEENETPGFRMMRLNALAGAQNDARTLLTTDDPAAVAALLATLAERHPDQYLTAGRDAGVLEEEGGTRLLWEPEDDGPDPPLVLAGHVNRVRFVSEWQEGEPE